MNMRMAIPLALIAICSSARADSFDPATGQVTIESIQVGQTVYSNVVVTIASIVSVGGNSSAGSYAGSYTGNYAGGGGEWTMTIDTSGVVTGSGSYTCFINCNQNSLFPLSGLVANTPGIEFTTSGGDICSGTINVSGGTMSGYCDTARNHSVISFTGTRQ